MKKYIIGAGILATPVVMWNLIPRTWRMIAVNSLSMFFVLKLLVFIVHQFQTSALFTDMHIFYEGYDHTSFWLGLVVATVVFTLIQIGDKK